MATPTLSVVVPVHDNASTLGDQLDALLVALDDDMEIVVVDNRSSDASRAVASRYADRDPRVRVIDAPDRPHAAYARNVGAEQARSDKLAFCDGDDIVAPTWARAIAAGLDDAEFVTGPVELDLLNPPWLAGVRGRRLFDERALLYDTVPFAHGCNFGVRRSTLERLGPFSYDMPLASEDIEFAVRAWRAGVDLVWCSDAVIHYRLRADARRRWRNAVVYGRTQAAIRALVPELVSRRSELERTARRIGWLLLRAPLTYRRALRAQWCWTLGLVVGEGEELVARRKRVE